MYSAMTRTSGLRSGFFTSIQSAPQLLYPLSEEADLTGKGSLEFKWFAGAGDLVRLDHYEFRLYKGYRTIASSLLLKNRLPAVSYSIGIEAELFDDNQIYTWTLRKAFLDGKKGELSSNSFRIIKRKGWLFIAFYLFVKICPVARA